MEDALNLKENTQMVEELCPLYATFPSIPLCPSIGGGFLVHGGNSQRDAQYAYRDLLHNLSHIVVRRGR
jgi:hypothetical protein